MLIGHRSTIIFALILMMATACSQDFDADQIATTDNVDDAEPGYAVPVEQALLYLDNELDMIYGDQTRAAMPRRTVKAVRNVEYRQVAQMTRAAEMPDDVADLFYIVEFADGEGSAVLGADARVEPVLAILDQTVLTPEDFEKADIESDDITSYMTAMIAKSATNQLASFPGITIGGDSIRQSIYIITGPAHDTVNVYKQSPLLQTKWNQYSPYNDLCYDHLMRKCPAGCGPVAIGQILKSNRYPKTIVIDDENIFDWTLLDECDYGSIPSDNAKAEVARFIYHIGQYTNIKYSLEGSGIYKEDAELLFRHIGYQSVSLQLLLINKARNMICNDRHAFYVRGVDFTQGGHAWVIDGWNEYTVRNWLVTTDYNPRLVGGPREISRELLDTQTYTRVHCNFGWGGKCDGYYTYNVFNTTNGDFNNDNYMITYSLPQ